MPHSDPDFVKQVHNTCDVVRENVLIPPLVSELVLAARVVCLVRTLSATVAKDFNAPDREDKGLASVNGIKLGDCLSEMVYHIGYVPSVCLSLI